MPYGPPIVWHIFGAYGGWGWSELFSLFDQDCKAHDSQRRDRILLIFLRVESGKISSTLWGDVFLNYTENLEKTPTPWSGHFRDHGLNPPLSAANPMSKGFSVSGAPFFGFGLASPAPKG